MTITVNHVLKWMEVTNDKIQKQKDYLTSLDQAIGDGDHGLNMARGFSEAIKKLSTSQYTTVSDIFKDVAFVLMSKVGGASGPLYGTAFLKMSMSVKGKESIDLSDLSKAVEEAINGLIQRGKAKQGDKTMLDVWIPVSNYLKENDSMNWDTFEATAKEAMEATKDIMAIKGRAAYLKERSIGHIDPGSASSYYLFSSLAEVMREGA